MVGSRARFCLINNVETYEHMASKINSWDPIVWIRLLKM